MTKLSHTQTAEVFSDGSESDGSDEDAGAATRPLGWGGFLLQFLTVVIAYIAASAPPIVIWGESGTGILGSLVTGMAGGILVAWLWLRRDGALRTAFSLQAPRNWNRAIIGAAIAAILVIGWFQLGAWLLRTLGLPEVDATLLLGFVIESPVTLILWIVLVAWLAAGTGEELLWRGFLMDRLGRLPGLVGRDWAVIGIQAVIFGLAHGYQSISGMIVTGLVGAFFGWMRLRVFASLWPLIFAHAAVDTISMSLAYFMPQLLN